jgi:hypothetical protein
MEILFLSTDSSRFLATAALSQTLPLPKRSEDFAVSRSVPRDTHNPTPAATNKGLVAKVQTIDGAILAASFRYRDVQALAFRSFAAVQFSYLEPVAWAARGSRLCRVAVQTPAVVLDEAAGEQQ